MIDIKNIKIQDSLGSFDKLIHPLTSLTLVYLYSFVVECIKKGYDENFLRCRKSDAT